MTPLHGGRGFWGKRAKYYSTEEVSDAVRAGEQVRAATFCPTCKTELDDEIQIFDRVPLNYCPVCGTKIDWGKGEAE